MWTALGQVRTASGQVLTPPRRLIIDVVKQKSKKHSRVWFHEQIDKQARNQLCDSFCSNASARPAFRQLGRAMGAGCSRRTRGHLRTASGWERLRPRPSVAERWALLFRKARGLQFLCHLFAYSGHALKFLYKKHPPLRDWRHPPLE